MKIVAAATAGIAVGALVVAASTIAIVGYMGRVTDIEFGRD